MAGMADKGVDSLIEALKREKDLPKRTELMVALDTRLNGMLPYVLTWEQDSEWILYWNKFGTAPYVYGKFYDYECITTYWYADAEKEKALSQAMKEDKALPPVPAEVRYGK
jgi:ABC-type oligopeptide transport system substrate-binding subunit